jgi:transposase
MRYPEYSGPALSPIQQLWQHNEFIPTGKIVNSGFYCVVLRRMSENVRRRRPELWRKQTWTLYDDNAPSHTSVFTQQFLAKHKMAVIFQTPYSPDLAPCDFFLFPDMKLKLKGRRFDTTEEIQGESKRVLNTDRKGLPGIVPKMDQTLGPVSTCGNEPLRG